MSVSIIRSKGLQDMSARTTAETPTMRERLARASCFTDECCFSRAEPCSSPADCDTWEEQLPLVDAILREMLEPSDGMGAAMMNSGNAEGLVMHTREFMDKRAVQAGYEPYPDDSEARKCVLLAMHWGWCRAVEHILNETKD